MNRTSIALIVCLVLSSAGNLPASAQPTTSPKTSSFTGSAAVVQEIIFVTTGSMNVARPGHTATLLNNGQVLAAGGRSGSSEISSAELYNPLTGTWTLTGGMNVARSGHTVTLLNNGKALAAGAASCSLSDCPAASAELYDSSTGIWTSTGSMDISHWRHTATLLNNGDVLVAGGQTLIGPVGPYSTNETELYNPTGGTWTKTDNMKSGRHGHTATLLNNGQVLVTGGVLADGSGSMVSLSSAELYNPVGGTWASTGSLSVTRDSHTATLLNNGKVLVAGGCRNCYGVGDDQVFTSAELYDPALGTWSPTGSMNVARRAHNATLLSNGKVLVTGGTTSHYSAPTVSAELYDPATGTWSLTGSLNVARSGHTVTLLNSGKVLVAGGGEFGENITASAELGTLEPPNTFTGTLTLPSGWLNSTTVNAEFVGTTSSAALNAGALSNDQATWGGWIAASPNVTTTTTWTVGSDGANKPIYLRLRDVNGQAATVVTGTVNVDTQPPVVAINALGNYQVTPTFNVTWSGTDATSGIANYDVQYRDGSGTWTDWQTAVQATSANFTGQHGHTFHFRGRARDNAGNLGAYSAGDTQTTMDLTGPTGSIGIVVPTGETKQVLLVLNAHDDVSGVGGMILSNRLNFAGATWESYATLRTWTLESNMAVAVRYRDNAGNVSETYSASLPGGAWNSFFPFVLK